MCLTMTTIEERRLEWFKDKFDELSNGQKISLYNEYSIANRTENEVESFDEDFFNMHYENNPYEAARAVHFGTINWSDEYIRFNGYGNLESLSESQIVEEAENAAEDIYEWGGFDSYIDMDDFEDEQFEDDDDLRMEGDL